LVFAAGPLTAPLCSPLGKGMKCVGRAVTLRFVPQRPDIQADKPGAGESPEYEVPRRASLKPVLYQPVCLPWAWAHDSWPCFSVLTTVRMWTQAFELCGNKDVLVMASVGPWESVGGDIKFLRLQQRNVTAQTILTALVRVTPHSISSNERCSSAMAPSGYPVLTLVACADRRPRHRRLRSRHGHPPRSPPAHQLRPHTAPLLTQRPR